MVGGGARSAPTGAARNVALFGWLGPEGRWAYREVRQFRGRDYCEFSKAYSPEHWSATPNLRTRSTARKSPASRVQSPTGSGAGIRRRALLDGTADAVKLAITGNYGYSDRMASDAYRPIVAYGQVRYGVNALNHWVSGS